MSWATDPFTWADVFITLWIVCVVAMAKSHGPGLVLDAMCAIGSLLLCVQVVAFLRLLSQSLARFVHALIAIIKDISSFCIVLTIVLISFGQALQNVLSPDDGHDDGGRFSSASSTAVSMFSLLLADFEEDEYGANLWARLFFVAFMILGVIVLLNVLIAIVSDSYMDAQQRSRNLFAVTRLHLAAEMLLVMPTWMFADAGYGPA